MTTLKKYNLEGKELGSVKISEELVNAEANGQMIKDYIVALRANARQWSANTKTRSEVNHTTKKPHPQKGGGRSRQGSLAAPQYKGGGRVFGPRPKFDQHVRINKKERRAAIRFLISEKIRDNRIHVLDSLEIEEPKTKTVATFLKNTGCAGRVLFLGAHEYVDVKTEEHTQKVSVSTDRYENFAKSVSNLPKASFALASDISGYDVLLANEIVLTESALNELNQWLCG